ncbi:MAG: toxin [Gemmataceae bacterium]|nr:toxin [Gemmataceae bacterium]
MAVTAGQFVPVADVTGGKLVFTPAANANGAGYASFTFQVQDDGGTANGGADTDPTPKTLTVDVTPVNDAPSFTKGPDQLVGRNPGAQTVSGWATAISAGPSNEATQTVTFLVTTSNPGLFAVQPAIDPATGTLAYTPTEHGFGTATVTVKLMDNGGIANGGVDTSAPQTFTITVTKHKDGKTGPVDQNEFPQFAVGAGVGGPGTVTVYSADGSVAYSVSPFGNGNGVRAVLADVTGDGVADVIAGTGPGVPAEVVVIDGVTHQVVQTFFPFGQTFTGGVFVAAGDLNGDGKADVIVSADRTGGPRVVVYDGATAGKLADFFGIADPNFRGGARVAIGDVNGDGTVDLIVSAGIGGGPRVAVYDGTSIKPGQTPVELVHDFFALDSGLRDGVFVTAGDLNGDGFDDLVFGSGSGGAPRVLALDGQALAGAPGGQFVTLTNYFAGDSNLRAGVRVAVKNSTGGKADLVTAVPTPAGSVVAVSLGKDLGSAGGPTSADFDLFPGLLSGVYLG